MLRIRPIAHERPSSVTAATDALQKLGEHGRVLGGGTDLLPNLKLGTDKGRALVSLAALPGLVGIAEDAERAGTVRIGAMTTLDVIANDPIVQRLLPSLAETVRRIASPQIRNQATIAGNLCLDTRCRYINQSDLFREALGGCLKSHGDACHVVVGSQNCVAALSCDTAPVLIALGARVHVVGGDDGGRTLAVADLYCTDGLAHTTLTQGELITAVEIPALPPTHWVTYRKWSRRKAIDFPLVSVALRLDTCRERDHLKGGMLVIGALGPKPRIVDLKKFKGRDIDAALAAEIGRVAEIRAKTLPNLPYDPAYRRRRAGVEAKRAVLAFMANR
ncbi:MAG: FAD binding domain-containing protein [Myxococcales bacterium]|nr:FAD binding domain-containing protein [Myxococcales bacterium]